MLLRAWGVILLSIFATICKNQGHVEVKLLSKPGVIHPFLTKQLQIRCAVMNSKWQSNRKCTTQMPPVPTIMSIWNNTMDLQDTTEPKWSHSHDKAEFSQLLSLMVTKTDQETGSNETIASVTGCDSPVIEKQFIGSVHVEGSSEGSPKHGEQGYIALTWDRPTEDQAGYFICKALALNSNKHSVELEASLEISAVEPKISDLVKYISLNERYIHECKAKFSELYEEKEKLRQLTRDLTERFENIPQALTNVTDGTIHVQSGTIDCDTDELKTVYFGPIFNSPPKVFISPISLKGSYFVNRDTDLLDTQYIDVSYSTSISSITSTMFTMDCRTDQSTLSIYWLALGAYD